MREQKVHVKVHSPVVNKPDQLSVFRNADLSGTNEILPTGRHPWTLVTDTIPDTGFSHNIHCICLYFYYFLHCRRQVCAWNYTTQKKKELNSSKYLCLIYENRIRQTERQECEV